MSLPSGTLLTFDDPVFPWPVSEGIWMGWLNDCWFPLKVKELKGDLQDMTATIPDETVTIAIVAQFPESETSWPYLFRGNHPVNQWRLPSEEEMVRAKHFYGLT